MSPRKIWSEDHFLSKNGIVQTTGKILNPDEERSTEQYLSSTQRETIQSRQSVSKINKDTDSMMAKQILCTTRVCVALMEPNRLPVRVLSSNDFCG
jgi:hypothetical protein